MKILFFTVHASTFTKGDLEILKSKHSVIYCDFFEKKIGFFNLIRLIKNNDVVFFWFISLRFVIPLIWSKLFNKKVIFVAGGYDVANLKELNYGSMSSRWKSFFIKNMIKLSDKVISVSYSNYNEIIDNCRTDPKKIEMIYHGLKPIKSIDFSKKENKIITIGFIDESSYYRKGIDRFLMLAGRMKNTDFHLIGKIDKKIDKELIPANVKIHGYLEKEEFINLLKSAKIYIQFSRHEAFGYSVAEAMQYGCIPVVSNVYSLPEIVGDTGLIIEDIENYNNIAEQVRTLLDRYNKDLALRCSKRIRDIFSMDKRSDKILNVIDNLN